ncbi:hypothetical protein HMN09_00917100 [Mycena chlorophos]|uniref:Uncharacterized protein n=1 Tax=Mycena chlorophos TaxID=658473 RepID=A0A8H6SJV5_MYCCL|nr:hypothetical protein HMN09_00917100 [Mycena chlorophos]
MAPLHLVCIHRASPDVPEYRNQVEAQLRTCLASPELSEVCAKATLAIQDLGRVLGSATLGPTSDVTIFGADIATYFDRKPATAGTAIHHLSVSTFPTAGYNSEFSETELDTRVELMEGSTAAQRNILRYDVYRSKMKAVQASENSRSPIFIVLASSPDLNSLNKWLTAPEADALMQKDLEAMGGGAPTTETWAALVDVYTMIPTKE